MPAPNAPKTLQDLEGLLEGDLKVKVAGVDVDGVLRGKYMSKEKFLSAVKGDGFGFCSVIFGWDIHDTTYSRELLISNRANGYRDMVAKVDLSTFRRIPWEFDVPFFLVSFLDPDTREPVCADPRGIIIKAQKQAAEFGWQCFAGVEYEYFQFKEDTHSAAEKKYTRLDPLTPGMHGYSLLRTQLNKEYFNDIFDLADQFGVNIEGHHTETGPGVYETALAYTNAARMADNAILFKYLVKSVGMKHGILPSFMAKPWGNLPGCSGHVHVSLKSEDGRNIFAVSDADLQTGRANAAYEDSKWLSEEGEWFLAGVLDGLTDVVPLFVPTINGYKRLVGGESFWAPNAVTWGYDSRAASIRVIAPPSCPPSATRLEIRVPGADMNPYFALSAIFLLGLRGIRKRIPLTLPPVAVMRRMMRAKELEEAQEAQEAQEGRDEEGNGTNASKGIKGIKGINGNQGAAVKLARSLEEATELFGREGSVAREVFGDEFVDHFKGTREHEVKLWNAAVTNWEVERYLELV